MNKIYLKVTICFLVIVIFNGCKTKNDYLNAFKIGKYEIGGNKDSTQTMVFTQRCRTFFDESYIKFYTPDTLTILSKNGDFALGKWKEDKENNTITIETPEIGKLKFRKEEEENDDKLEYLVLTGKNVNDIDVKLILKIDPYFESKTRDLVTFSSNWWRIKPMQHETKEQIKKRVIAQIDYMINYFELLDENKYTSYFESHLISPYKFYANGIELTPLSNNLQYSSLFFDDKDAAIAYELLKGGINSIVKYERDSERYTSGYIKALNEIKRFIKVA